MTLRLRPFEDHDLALFEAWLALDHIRPWYSPAGDWLEEVRGRHGAYAFICHHIILAGDTPIGFCQYYPYDDGGESWHGAVSLDGTYSIDYLIGDTAFLKKGCATAALIQLGKLVFAQADALRIIVQPEVENIASCKTLLAAGYAYDEENQLFILNRP